MPSSFTITYVIIGFTVLVSVLAFRDRRVFENMMFEPFVVNTRKDWFRFITHGFIHANTMHLVVNMYALFLFGPVVERGFAEITGRPPTLPFLVLYLGAMILSSMPSFFKHRWDPSYRALGASGATSAVLFAAILMVPTMRLSLLLLPIPTPAWLFGLLYLGYEWYMGKRGGDNIGHDAHFAGALVGLLFTAILDPHVVQRFIEAITGRYA